MLTRSYHSADCDTDHALVISRLRIRPLVYHQSKRSGLPKLDTTKTRSAEAVKSFNDILGVNLDSIDLNIDIEVLWEDIISDDPSMELLRTLLDFANLIALTGLLGIWIYSLLSLNVKGRHSLL